MIEYQYNIINFSISEKSISEWLENVISLEKSNLGDVGFIFCDDEFLWRINRQFLHHDTYTDILTFPTSKDQRIISGEIYISVDRVRENAILRSDDFEKELSRVMVHGILHLLGYKDKVDPDILMMRQKEDYYLSLLS